MRGIGRIVVERKVRIGKLIVIEDVERLRREYQVEALGKLDFLFERNIDLPGDGSRDDAAARVSKSLDYAGSRMAGRGRESCRVDPIVGVLTLRPIRSRG